MSTRSNFSEQIWFLRRPASFSSDIAVLSTAFFLAYLPAINIQLGEYYLEPAASASLPFVVLDPVFRTFSCRGLLDPLAVRKYRGPQGFSESRVHFRSGTLSHFGLCSIFTEFQPVASADLGDPDRYGSRVRRYS